MPQWFIELDALTQWLIFAVFLLLSAAYYLGRIFFEERVKVKAAESTNRKLMQETEQLKSTYAMELEEIRKDHQLEIRKRTYLYELKKGEYTKYFQILDKFTADFRLKSQGTLMEHIRVLLEETIAAGTDDARNAASIKFSNHINGLFGDISKEFEIVRKESNSIRLGASDKVIEKLNAVDNLYNVSMDFSTSMLNRLLSLMLAGDVDAIQADQAKLMVMANETNEAIKDLMASMRKDLGEI